MRRLYYSIYAILFYWLVSLKPDRNDPHVDAAALHSVAVTLLLLSTLFLFERIADIGLSSQPVRTACFIGGVAIMSAQYFLILRNDHWKQMIEVGKRRRGTLNAVQAVLIIVLPVALLVLLLR